MKSGAGIIRDGYHIAIIMDGNGRWASQRGLPRRIGHVEGVKSFKSIVKCCPSLGIKFLTVFAFSTENWSRSRAEVSALMYIFGKYIKSEAQELYQNNVRVKFIGDRSILSKRLKAEMMWLENLTSDREGLNLTVALNYGSRDEICRAVKLLAADVKNGVLSPDDVGPGTIDGYLDTRVLPDPDLVIRTSGETRISNFLLWQSAYAEYEFTPTLWPDFTAEELAEIIARFSRRERRYGGVVAV